jgi:aldehyde dehydrogenase (NAD+)
VTHGALPARQPRGYANNGHDMDQHFPDASLGAAAAHFLSRGRYGLLIDGQSVPAGSGATFDTRNPSTGEVLGQLAAGAQEDVDRAVRAARAAFQGPWSRWTPYERQALLYRAHEAMDRHFEELA